MGYDDILGDGQVPTALIETVTNLDIRNQSITDLTGIEDFTALDTLICSNNALTILDISANAQLVNVDASMNSIAEREPIKRADPLRHKRHALFVNEVFGERRHGDILARSIGAVEQQRPR